VSTVAAATAPRGAVVVPDEEVKVYGHTRLFYWWPVWLVGFIMAFLTYVDGKVMAVVPEGTVVEQQAAVPGQEGPRDVLVAPAGQAVPPQPGKQTEGAPPQPTLRVAASNNYGVIFVGVFLFVLLTTHITVRGLASVIVIAGLAVIGLLFAQLGLWDPILAWLGGLDVRMNAGGYMAFAVPIFLIWVFTVFVYDHYTYLIFSRGQVRIRKEIGDGETAIDASGVSLEKKRDDFFRHWLLGFGAGDLRVKMPGNNGEFELCNVFGVNWKLGKIQDMLREKEVANQGPGG